MIDCRWFFISGTWKAHKLVCCNCASCLVKIAISVSFPVLCCHSVLPQSIAVKMNFSKRKRIWLEWERLGRFVYKVHCRTGSQNCSRVTIVKSRGLLSQPFLHPKRAASCFCGHRTSTSPCYRLPISPPDIKCPVHQSPTSFSTCMMVPVLSS